MAPPSEVSVIVPAYNAGRYIATCLSAIRAHSVEGAELIVVDDCSTDDTGDVAARLGAKVIRMSRRSGPAAARNRGVVEARGRVLVFVDADVVVSAGAIEGLVRDLAGREDVGAVFGSYDDAPAEPNLLSQYKNLYHHFVHQYANADAAHPDPPSASRAARTGRTEPHGGLTE